MRPAVGEGRGRKPGRHSRQAHSAGGDEQQLVPHTHLGKPRRLALSPWLPAVTLASDTEAEAVGMLEAILEAASIYRQVAGRAWHATTPQRQVQPKCQAPCQLHELLCRLCGRATAGSRRCC